MFLLSITIFMDERFPVSTDLVRQFAGLESNLSNRGFL
jgi:hypothetical protein